MATWVECKSVTDEKPVYVNLEQIVAIKASIHGSELIYATGESLIVATPPDELLSHQKVY